MSEITKALCDERHGDVMRAIADLRGDLKETLEYIRGNGKPGLRHTQAELEALRLRVTHIERTRKEWLLLVAKPIISLLLGTIGGLGMFLLSLYFQSST